MHRNTPVRLIASILSNDSWLSSWVRCPIGPTDLPATPALLKAQSIRPNAETVRATIAATSVSRVTSPPIAMAWWLEALISATVAAALSSLRSATATRAPSRAIATAVARPMPEAPPVTSAIFPSRIPVICRSPRRTFAGFTRIRAEGGLLIKRAIAALRCARGRVPRMQRSAPHLRRGALLVRGPPAWWVPDLRSSVTRCIASGTRTFRSDAFSSIRATEYFRFTEYTLDPRRKSPENAPILSRKRGVGHVTDVGAGCGGRVCVARRAARMRTAKACGPDARIAGVKSLGG